MHLMLAVKSAILTNPEPMIADPFAAKPLLLPWPWYPNPKHFALTILLVGGTLKI
jgi:hypothetical protein